MARLVTYNLCLTTFFFCICGILPNLPSLSDTEKNNVIKNETTQQALFFTACVAALVIGARPEYSATSSAATVVPIANLMQADQSDKLSDQKLMASLTFDDQWYDQGKPASELKIDHEKEGLTEQDQDDFTPQLGFEKWRGAPYWMHFREIPVSFNREAEQMKQEKLVVVGHTTDREATPLFLASIHKHGLAAAVTGVDTWWHNFEDKNMGLKAALLKIPEEQGDPVVIFSDASDSMYTCGADEMLSRFNKLDADVVVGTETQCWPPDSHNCDMGQAVMEEGMAAGMSVVSDEGRIPGKYGKKGNKKRYPLPRMWGNGGVIMGRRSKMLELMEDFESFLVENEVQKANRGKGTNWGTFYKSCRPYNMTAEEWHEAITAKDPTTWMSYDDQLCLNRFMIEKAAKFDLRVKFDRDSTLLHTMGGTEPRNYKLDEYNRPYWPDTMKSPCVWHFNNPICKAFMKPMIKKFPGAFV